jgi:hypothetical protein
VIGVRGSRSSDKSGRSGYRSSLIVVGVVIREGCGNIVAVIVLVSILLALPLTLTPLTTPATTTTALPLISISISI